MRPSRASSGGKMARLKTTTYSSADPKEHGLSVFEELVNAITGESFLRNMRMAT